MHTGTPPLRATGWRSHALAAGGLALAAVANLGGWLALDRMPPGDFAGYAAQIESVREALLGHGRVPAWCVECYGGTTNFTANLKEVLAFPLAVWGGPVLAGKALFAALQWLAALGLYAVVARLAGAPLAGAVAGYAYGFGTIAAHRYEHLDVALAAALLPPLFLATLELFRRGSAVVVLSAGALAAAQLANNWVHALPAPAAALGLLLLRPWREPGENGLRRGWPWRALAALGVFGLLAASPLAWVASDARHHRLVPERSLEALRGVYVERSPFLFLNRANALGPWLEAHHPPGLEVAAWDADRRYLGIVALAVCLAGAFAGRREPRLRRLGLLAAAMFGLQYWLALGPRTLLWEVGGSLHWSPAVQRAVGDGLLAASAACTLLAAALAWRARRGGRTALAGPLLAAALVLFFPTHSLWKGALALLPPLAVQRSPGHYFDTAPFWLYLGFGLALAALQRRVRRPAAGRALVAAVALAAAADFWPGTRVLSEGLPMREVREAGEMLAALPGEEGTLRLALAPGYSPLASFLAQQAPPGHAWGWLPWQAGRHWPELVREAAWGRGGDARARARLLANARIAYFLVDERDERAARAGWTPELPPPWRRRAATGRFSLWEQPDVSPLAWGERAGAPLGASFVRALRRPRPERIELEVDAGARDALVIVSQGHHPWWRATVDGAPAPVRRARIALLAVPVGPGAHTVELRLERPALVAAADRLCAAGWVGLGLAALGGALRRRRGPPQAP